MCNNLKSFYATKIGITIFKFTNLIQSFNKTKDIYTLIVLKRPQSYSTQQIFN